MQTTTEKKNESPPSRAAILFYSNDSDLQSRSHRIFCVTQDSSCPHGAWGRSLNKRKKPPAFRNGKQVVLSIWVPGGIACMVTILATVLGIHKRRNPREFLRYEEEPSGILDK